MILRIFEVVMKSCMTVMLLMLIGMLLWIMWAHNS